MTPELCPSSQQLSKRSLLFLTLINLAGGGQAARGAGCHGLDLQQISMNSVLVHSVEKEMLFSSPKHAIVHLCFTP